MRHPPRLGHLATRAVVVAKLVPTYAEAHRLDDEEAQARLDTALRGALLDQLLDATWEALLGSTKRLDESALLEKVAGALKERPQRPGKRVPVTGAWSAFLLLVDLHAGTASEMARRVLESEEGKQKIAAGLAEVGRFLAKELTRP